MDNNKSSMQERRGEERRVHKFVHEPCSCSNTTLKESPYRLVVQLILYYVREMVQGFLGNV
jgi:hypothetical protein